LGEVLIQLVLGAAKHTSPNTHYRVLPPGKLLSTV